jgi:hypothetical protein
MLGMWTSVDGHKEFYNSYSYGPINPINGYDEEGHRTEDWVLETTYSYEQAYDIANKSKSQEYAERNSAKAREYVPSGVRKQGL